MKRKPIIIGGIITLLVGAGVMFLPAYEVRAESGISSCITSW